MLRSARHFGRSVIFDCLRRTSMVVCAYNPTIQEAETVE